MPKLSDDERAELARLGELVGEAKIDAPVRIDGTLGPIDPMLAETWDGDLKRLDEAGWISEAKIDGTRLICECLEGTVELYTRRGIERSAALPEIADALTALPQGIVLDGEMAFLDEEGIPCFFPIHGDRAKLASRGLEPRLFLFDILYRDQDLTQLPLMERKEHLADVLDDGAHALLSMVAWRDQGFQAHFSEIVEGGGEGLILKRRASRYELGVRSRAWRKVKAVQERDAIAVGYTEGEGTRAGTFGALVLFDGERYIGRVGSGFTQSDLEDLFDRLEPAEERLVSLTEAGGLYTPTQPLVVEVRHQGVTNEGKLRAPVFVRLRPDKSIEDVVPLA